MVEYLLTLSFLIIAILLIREIFRKNISPIITYLLWLAVVFKLIMPFSFFEAELSVRDKYKSDIVSSSDDELIDYESQDSEFIVPPPMIDITDNITTDITDKIDSSEDEISLLPGIENTDNDKLFDFSNLYNIIICIWVIGSAVMAIGFAVSGTVFYFRLRKDRILYRIVKKTKVYVSDNVGTPCLAGIFPSIYITSDSIKSKGQTLIIAHEYTHLRHGDHIWSFIRILAIIVHWWNPIVWAAAIASKQDSELACDETIVSKLDVEQRFKYARTIIDTVPQKHRYAIGFGSAPIKERIITITKRHKKRTLCAILSIVLVIASVGCSFIGKYKLTTDNICEQKGFTILSQTRREITLEIPMSDLPTFEEVSENDDLVWESTDDIVVYEKGASSVILENIGVVNDAREKNGKDILAVGFNIKHDLTDENTILMLNRVVNSGEGLYYSLDFTIPSGLIIDDKQIYKNEFVEMGNVDNDSFYIYLNADIYSQLMGTVKITVTLNELTYRRGSDVKIYDKETHENKTEHDITEIDSNIGYIGYIASRESEMIDIFDGRDGNCVASIPWETVDEFLANDRSDPFWTPGWMESITFHYGEIEDFRWVVVNSGTAMGQGKRNVCTSNDGGKTWWVGNETDFVGSITGAIFASTQVGFIGHQYWMDDGPNIMRTLDGGKTWSRMDISVPYGFENYKMTPLTPVFNGSGGIYPIQLTGGDGESLTAHLITYDGGITWNWDLVIKEKASNTFVLPVELDENQREYIVPIAAYGETIYYASSNAIYAADDGVGYVVFGIGSHWKEPGSFDIIKTYRVITKNQMIYSVEECGTITKESVTKHGKPFVGDLDGIYSCKAYSDSGIRVRTIDFSNGKVKLSSYIDGTDAGGTYDGKYTYDKLNGKLELELSFGYHDGSGKIVTVDSIKVSGKLYEYGSFVHFICESSNSVISPYDPVPLTFALPLK